MEINQYHDEITGVVVMSALPECRFGVLAKQSTDYDYGSRTDLPGFRLPVSAVEAKNARQLITWAVDNRPFPNFIVPTIDWSLRTGGWDQTQVNPFSTTMYLTNPGNQKCQTIPSGSVALAFGKGVYTLPSGCWVHSAAMHNPGTLIQICNDQEDTTDSGKPKELSVYSDRKVGQVRYYNAANDDLTIEVD